MCKKREEVCFGIWLIALFLIAATASALPHPADNDSNYELAIEEFTAYQRAYKLQEPWTMVPSPPSISYYTRALYLFKQDVSQGFYYHSTSSQACPLCWSRGVESMPPTLDVSAPANGIVVSTPSIVVSGTASDDSGIASVTVNGIAATTSNAYATWGASVPLTAGSNTLTVIAVDGYPTTNTRTVTLTVTYAPPNQPPIANAGPDKTINVNTPVSLSGALSSDPDGSIVSYSWNFGDGTPAGTGVNVQHTYATTGTKTVTLTVTDNQGASAQDSVTVTVNPAPVPGETLWVKNVVSTAGDNGYAVAFDRRLNCDSSGGTDCFVVGGSIGRLYMKKYDSSGNVIWDSGINSDGGNIKDLAVDVQGNVYATGNYASFVQFPGGTSFASVGGYDLFVVKYNATGGFQWAKRYGSTWIDGFSVEESGEAVAVDSAGNIYIGGFNNGYPIDFGCATASVSGSFILKLDAAGNCVSTGWPKIFGSLSTVGDIVLDASGEVYATGGFTGTLNFGNGNVQAAGTNPNFFVARYSPQGAYRWEKNFVGPTQTTAWSEGTSLALDGAGNVYSAGYFRVNQAFGGSELISAGNDDIFLVKYRTADGSHVWSKRFGGAANRVGSFKSDVAYGVAVSPAGTVFLAGGVTNTPVDLGGGSLAVPGFGVKAFVSSYNPDGTFRWGKTAASTTGIATAYKVELDSGGNPVAVGTFTGTTNFSGVQVATSGSQDLFMWKLAK